MSLTIVPITLEEANAFVQPCHRNLKPVIGDKFSTMTTSATGSFAQGVTGRGATITATVSWSVSNVDRLTAEIACPECGGSLTTWKCLCEPVWRGYAAPQSVVSEDGRDAERYRCLRATMRAIRDDNGEQRTEVTPEEFDAAVDAMQRETQSGRQANG